MLAHEDEQGLRDPASYARFAEGRARVQARAPRPPRSACGAPGKQVVGYGAPGKGNTLLNYCGIRTDFLDYTVDRNPYKQGKHTPGTHIPIHPPEKIAETRPDVIVILPWNLAREISSSSHTRPSGEPGWSCRSRPRPASSAPERPLLCRRRARTLKTRRMKVVIFCGGLGVRMGEETQRIPKPMIRIGNRPILWHIMRYYAAWGHKEFVLCLGYKGDVIREYFLNYNEALFSDFVLEGHGAEARSSSSTATSRDWRITFADTGMQATIGGRLKAVEPYLGDDEIFLATYGDGLTDAPLDRHDRRVPRLRED